MQKRIYRLPAAVLFSELSWTFRSVVVVVVVFLFFVTFGSFNKTKKRLSLYDDEVDLFYLRPSSGMSFSLLSGSNLCPFPVSSFFEWEIYVLRMRNRDCSYKVIHICVTNVARSKAAWIFISSPLCALSLTNWLNSSANNFENMHRKSPENNIWKLFPFTENHRKIKDFDTNFGVRKCEWGKKKEHCNENGAWNMKFHKIMIIYWRHSNAKQCDHFV